MIEIKDILKGLFVVDTDGNTALRVKGYTKDSVLDCGKMNTATEAIQSCISLDTYPQLNVILDSLFTGTQEGIDMMSFEELILRAIVIDADGNYCLNLSVQS